MDIIPPASIFEIRELVSWELQFLVSVWYVVESALNIFEVVVEVCDPWKPAMSIRIDLESLAKSVILVFMASRRRPTAATSCRMRSMATSKCVPGEVSVSPKPVGVGEKAMGRGCVIASENSNWRVDLLQALLVASLCRKG
ncbi:hypothetical protein NDU88_005085 [Pleurodeles waltl]|uniref:Uncharacterized protein n=1 Tax=Pleurodeles waltl TaxID=8319 RepID=A0AAV7LK02_PLEWA|nr:hypothetical protein NDU88_005085 [Pleurodeles waltl]